MTPEVAVYAIWFVWGGSWLLASRWASASAKRPSGAGEIGVLILIFAGFFLAFCEGPSGSRSPILWRAPEPLQWAMVGLTAVSFLFAWWARLRMGALWSVTVQAKADHRVIDDGPFALVRHPIYSGLIFGTLARTVVEGSVLSLLGFAMVATGFWLKARLEERFLTETLGADAYGAYAARVKRLIPFVL